MPVRVFGYGSLVWRPDFPFTARWPARLPGWARRFWQGSPDHRGTPERPGRVATLVPDPAEVTVGLVYEVAPADAPAVLAGLDHRERAGFDRVEVLLEPLGGGPPVPGLVYCATEDNPWFLGPAPLDQLAAHVATARGASGDNATYVLALDEALCALGVQDPHTAALAAAVRALRDTARACQDRHHPPDPARHR